MLRKLPPCSFVIPLKLKEEVSAVKTSRIAVLLALGLCSAVFGADAPAEANPNLLPSRTLTQDAAEKIVAAAKDFAAKRESPIYKPAKLRMHIHVLGREGTLLASTQALGAWPGSADIAGRKARTAWLFKLPTRVIGELSRPEKEAKGPLYGIEVSNSGLITFPGGLPIFDEAGQLVGAIGVSGDTVDEDEKTAQAGVDAFKGLKDALAPAPSLSQAGAEIAVAAAKSKAAELQSGVYKAKTKMHIHVIGLEGTLLAATQASDAWPGSHDIAGKKAKTALLFKLPTRVIGSLSRPEQADKGPLYGIELSNSGLITFPGGLPIKDAAGNTVGAIGVSGDTVDKDEEVAKAGVDAIAKLLKP
jgi:uncharacterized protein GlcG (DUF336 family)